MTVPAFRAAYNKRRCLVLADGVYEWKKVEGGKHGVAQDFARFYFQAEAHAKACQARWGGEISRKED